MNKKIFLVAFASLSIIFGGINSLQASAWEIQPRTIEGDDANDNYDDIVEPHNDINDDLAPCDNTLEDCPAGIDEELENGTSDEPLVVCADKNEPDCLPNSDETKEDVEDTDNDLTVRKPAVWPMIVSFSALGVAAVAIVVLNITGPKIK